ncbi:MAG: WHG domain-containing protein [Nocardioides alkalitolerans]
MSRSSAGYHHGNLRPVLLAAALDLLETQAPGTVSLRELARRAGVSHNAPYHHFGDRAGLLAAAGAEAMRRFVDAQRAAAEAEEDPVASLVALGTAYVGWAVAHPGAFAVVFDPEICPPGDPSPTMGGLIAENEELLRAAVARAWPDAPEATRSALETALWSTTHGLATLVAAGHVPASEVRPALEAILRR